MASETERRRLEPGEPVHIILNNGGTDLVFVVSDDRVDDGDDEMRFVDLRRSPGAAGDPLLYKIRRNVFAADERELLRKELLDVAWFAKLHADRIKKELAAAKRNAKGKGHAARV